MRGDVVVVEKHHRNVAQKIVEQLLGPIGDKVERYTIMVSGESGSGKSETAWAIAEQLEKHEIKSVILGQDDYFVYPPKTNHNMRLKDKAWLGPMEVRLELLNSHLQKAREGIDTITKPLVDYAEDSIGQENVDLQDIKVVIAEGTYTALCKAVDTRVFISRNRLETMEHRTKRNRGKEVGDPFIESILEIEHKIISGHRHLADFVITKDYELSGNT